MTNILHLSIPEHIVDVAKEHARKLNWSVSKLIRTFILKFDTEVNSYKRKYPDMEVYDLYRELKNDLVNR